ncbi:hypothetical protein BC832DRAFT_552638 [Gaertneriomyces semiglobifer]|nr:hypothetical protein BC832DRAFT_552638 [Gaertneriomyces semiglobifer]
MEIPLRDVVQVQGRKRQSTLSDSFFPVTKRRVGNNHEKISDLQAKTTDSIFVAHPKLALPTPKHCLREGKLMRCVTVEALVTSHTLQDGMNRRGASCLECGISTIELFGHVANVRNPQRNKWEFSLVDKPMDTTGPMSLRSDYWEIDHPFPRVLCEGDTGVWRLIGQVSRESGFLVLRCWNIRRAHEREIRQSVNAACCP